MYDHSNSDHESGDSMSDSSGRDSSQSPTKRKPTSASANSSEKPRTCSYCGTEFLGSQSKHGPFCSRRCQQIDLGMWLNESHGIPCEGDESGASFEEESE